MTIFSIARKSSNEDSGNGYKEQFNSIKTIIDEKKLAGKRAKPLEYKGSAFKTSKFGMKVFDYISKNIDKDEKEHHVIFTRAERMYRDKHHLLSFLSDLSKLSKKNKFSVKFHFSHDSEQEFTLDPKDHDNFGVTEEVMAGVEQGYVASNERSEIGVKAHQDLEMRKRVNKETKERVWIGMLQHLVSQNKYHRPPGLNDNNFTSQICDYLNCESGVNHFNPYYKGRFMKWYLEMMNDEFEGTVKTCSKCNKTRLISATFKEDSFECSDLLGCKCGYPVLDTDKAGAAVMELEDDPEDDEAGAAMESEDNPEDEAGAAMESEDEEVFPFHSILESKISDGKEMFLIHWKGNWKNNPTWEPKENIPEGEVSKFYRGKPFCLAGAFGNMKT